MKNIWRIQSLSDLFDCIGCDKESLEKAIKENDEYYGIKIRIPKKNGHRIIYKVNKASRLYDIQKNLCHYFLGNIMISDNAFGFKKDCNYFDFLEEHKNFYGNSNYLRLDISDFFGSISKELLENVLNYYVDISEDKEKEKVVTYLLDIILYEDKLIQGTPIAPVVSNLVFRSLDIRIERYCCKQKIVYSRYVDDLLFSSENRNVFSKNFIRTIKRILKSKGFDINYSKLRKANNRMALNGFVVDENVRLSRKKLKPIGRILFYMETNCYEGSAKWVCKYNMEMEKYKKEKDVTIKNKNDLINLLAGYRSFLLNAKKYSENPKYDDHINNIIERIQKQIDKIEQQ